MRWIMYRIFTVTDVVRVPPSYFTEKLEGAVAKMLRHEHERRVDKDLGIILAIEDVRDLRGGKVILGDGSAYYDATFDVLAYMPELQEVFEGEVRELVEFGAFIRMGPMDGLVHVSQIADDFLTYEKNMPAFVGRESKRMLKSGDVVRAKIATVSLKSSIPETKIGLTMRAEGLGKAEWAKLRPVERRVKKTKAQKEAERAARG